MLDEAEGRHRQFRQLRGAGQAAIQKEFDVAVREGKLIRNFEPLMIPGLLQTSEYARYRVLAAIRNHDFPAADADASLGARMQRQQVLYETGRTFEFVIGEEALYRRLAPLPAMLGQIDRLLALDLPQVTFGIVPLDADLSEGLELVEAFLMVDNLVYLESYSALRDPKPRESSEYEGAADALRAEAVIGDEARHLLTRAGDHLRGLQRGAE